MNDYISYTVIATGFDSARSNYAPKTIATKKSATTRLPENNGGFTFFGQENIDSKDLDVPTILRVNSPKASIDDEEEKIRQADLVLSHQDIPGQKKEQRKKIILKMMMIAHLF